MDLITTNALTRCYGPRRGIDNVNLRVSEGEIFGFLGPNGAGKTTAIRVMLGFLAPTSGEARIFGLDCWRDARRIKRDVGYAPGDLRLYSWMNGEKGIRIFSGIRGQDLSAAGRDLADLFDLDMKVKVRNMSRGMRQKLGLILALAHRPRLLILDEPSSALDPLMQAAFHRHLRELARDGHTVFFSSHTLSEVEQLCDRVAIVSEGRIVVDETLDALRRRTGHQVTIRWRASAGDEPPVPPFLEMVEREPHQWTCMLDGDVGPLVAWLAGQPLADLSVGRPDLEVLFRRYYLRAGDGDGEGRDMINRGLISKALHELLPITVLFGTLALLFEGALAFVLPKFAAQLTDQMMQIPFLQSIVKAVLGVDISGEIGPSFIMAMCWAHPVVLAITWAHAIVSCTRIPAGEVDRGTIDILLGLPISRWQLFLTETAVWLAGGVTLLALAILGNTLGGMFAPPETRPALYRVLIVLVNLMCLYMAVGSLALLMSALSDRRGRAITVVFVVVLVSFLLSFLAQFWAPAEKLAVLSVLQYYRPVFILRDGTWPIGDIAVLLAVAGALWTIAGVVFSRRDLCTV